MISWLWRWVFDGGTATTGRVQSISSAEEVASDSEATIDMASVAVSLSAESTAVEAI
jgi:hypothetical protein